MAIQNVSSRWPLFGAVIIWRADCIRFLESPTGLIMGRSHMLRFADVDGIQ